MGVRIEPLSASPSIPLLGRGRLVDIDRNLKTSFPFLGGEHGEGQK